MASNLFSFLSKESRRYSEQSGENGAHPTSATGRNRRKKGEEREKI
jgi:hypothetical protein